jgi:hypothetical protein
MPTFNKTVSQLTRAELLSATAAFGLDSSGAVTALRARVKAHLKDNEDLMDNPDYVRLFTPAQRALYATYPAPWGGIVVPPAENARSSSPSSDSGSDARELEAPDTGTDSPSDLQALQSLPANTLAQVLDLFVTNG